MERTINTGISALAIYCRTSNMRKTGKATTEKLREIAGFFEEMGKDMVVVENGDCLGYKDAGWMRKIAGAHSVMITTAAEANSPYFSPIPLVNFHQTLIPTYLHVSGYLDNR